MSVPSYMQALVQEDFSKAAVLREIAVPKPGPGEVLMKVAASPVNPSDLALINGLAKQLPTLPFVPGLEGSGVVIQSGGGIIGRLIKGRRVACIAEPQNGGLWAEYCVTPARYCIPLRRNVSLEAGAMLLVNPLTAWAFMDIARKHKSPAVINNAAAGALGKMVWRLGKSLGIQVINIVHKPERASLLHKLGASYVFDSSKEDWEPQLQRLCEKLGANIAFDAVAGSMTNSLLKALPEGGSVYVYGSLSESHSQADSRMIISGNKRIQGFWLGHWIRRKNPLQILAIAWKAQKNLSNNLQSEISRKLSLAEATEAASFYERNMSAGKILIQAHTETDFG